MPGRNRAEGWRHAKLSGHSNEELVADLVRTDADVRDRLLNCVGLHNVRITEVLCGGLCETNVDCILGGSTKSKTDMCLLLSSGGCLNVSIKKEPTGQVFLIGIARFIEGFERHYHVTMDDDIIRAMELYFGSSDDVDDIIGNYGGRYSALELRKHRLVAETLGAYSKNLYHDLLDWFDDNMPNIFDYCFSRGLAKNSSDWADIIWYKNMLHENSLDKMFYLPDLAANMPYGAEYSHRNGGSTIRLPFGFVQWHSPRKVIPGNLQFHHDYFQLCRIGD